MGHTVGDGIIVAALAAAFVAYLYFRHIERQRQFDRSARAGSSRTPSPFLPARAELSGLGAESRTPSIVRIHLWEATCAESRRPLFSRWCSRE
jgi:hypothetical protein